MHKSTYLSIQLSIKLSILAVDQSKSSWKQLFHLIDANPGECRTPHVGCCCYLRHKYGKCVRHKYGNIWDTNMENIWDANMENIWDPNMHATTWEKNLSFTFLATAAISSSLTGSWFFSFSFFSWGRRSELGQILPWQSLLVKYIQLLIKYFWVWPHLRLPPDLASIQPRLPWK